MDPVDRLLWQALPQEVRHCIVRAMHAATNKPFGSIALSAPGRVLDPSTSTPSLTPEPPHPTPPVAPERRFPRAAPKPKPKRTAHHVKRIDVVEDSHGDDPDVMCVEVTKGRRRLYRARPLPHADDQAFDITDERISNRNAAKDLLAGYLLPQGFPESVAPQYASYMRWRACQYFFGGAMSVYTTRSLLGALGVGGRHQGEAAAAINWVVKDGAGRLGRFLFARWGRALDCELKQFRLIGDLLMETAAALELSTIAAPRAFLPLACTANLAKNLAAVAASSTRAPIYRTFAKHNNLADVTAKGESVANLADIAGTMFGIALTKTRLPAVNAFCLLSCGYLYASRKEIDSVELPYLNRARLSYAAQHFLNTGEVPSIAEANAREPLLPWGASQRVVLGASVEDAVDGPRALGSLLETWRDRKYALSYQGDTKKVYVVLREGASGPDILEAAFHAQHFLHALDRGGVPERLLRETAREAPALFDGFARLAVDAGWKLQLTMLNPSETRLRVHVVEDL